MSKDINQEKEMLDVIDENGKVILVLPKDEVIKKHLLHKTVHVEVFNHKGEILVGLRSPSKKIYPNLWDSGVAGHISSGESERETAIREMKEEIGVDVDPQYFDNIRVNTAEVDEFIFIFIIRFNGPFEANEAVELKFVSVSQAKKLNSTPPFKKILELMEKRKLI
jgi:isopentenyl-diphosphate Delta-isomerase